MRLLHREFKEAINQTAIAISPVVVIGKHRADGQPDAGHCITISSKTFTQPTFSMDHRILPLLLKFPSTSSNSLSNLLHNSCIVNLSIIIPLCY